MNECVWTYDRSDHTWNASCRSILDAFWGMQFFEEGLLSPKENGFVYCPFCAKPLVEAPDEVSSLEDEEGE